MKRTQLVGALLPENDFAYFIYKKTVDMEKQRKSTNKERIKHIACNDTANRQKCGHILPCIVKQLEVRVCDSNKRISAQ